MNMVKVSVSADFHHAKQPKKGNINTPVRSSALMSDSASEGLKMSTTLAQVTGGNDTYVTQRVKNPRPSPASTQENSPNMVNLELSLSPQKDSLSELKQYMKELLQNQTDSIREAINALNETIHVQNSRIEQLEARISLLENEPKQTLPLETSALENEISKLQSDVIERDQILLRNDVEVAGCPEVGNENCIHMTLLIAKKIGIELDEKDIVSAERVGPMLTTTEDGKAPLTRPLVVRLARRATRDAILQAARKRRELDTSGLDLPKPIRRVYINERLTKHNRHLFKKARSLAREKSFKYVWTREGKIYTRQEQGKQCFRLRNELDLQRVFN